jgi:glycosyltransferase involved in cell wall biosynthesis
MRIAYLTNVLTDTVSAGGSVHVTQVAKCLIERGHTLYTNLQNESDNFVKFTVKDFFKKRKEIDIFYVRIPGWAKNDELTLLRKSNPFAPCIWEVNSPLEELRTLGISEEKLQKLNKRRKKLSKMVDVAICVCDEMGRYARDELGIEKIFVIPNGSDPELFTPEKKDENIYDKTKYKILWAGSPKYSWQGMNIIQKLAKTLKEKNIDDVLIIVTAEGKSSENLLYLGHIPYSEMPRYMASADAGILLRVFDFYRFYGSPLKLYDYMASGLPVIGTNGGQIELVLEENQNGLLTDNSIEDLIEKILFLKNNPDIASEMGLRGRKAVSDKYNWENVVLQTESILLAAIENHRDSLNNSLKGRLLANLNNWEIIKYASYLLRNIKVKNLPARLRTHGKLKFNRAHNTSSRN